MKILRNTDIVSVKAGDLTPGMVLPDGIVKATSPANRHGDMTLVDFFGGNTGFIATDRAVNVIARIDDTLLANMMGA